MFYWSYKDVHVVLSDDEEVALIEELGKDPLEQIGYFIIKKARKDIERRIFKYLEKSLHKDPEAFYRKYVFRSCSGKNAQKIFPVLLDAYGRITRRATIGFFGESESSQLDEIAENIYYATTDKVYKVTLFERRIWPWAKPRICGFISLPVSSIEKVAGTADNFFVTSTLVTVKFHHDFVRISIMDINNRKNNTQRN